MTRAQLAEEGPTRLAWLFRHSQRSAHGRPGDLLPIACQLLRQATDGLVTARGCSRIAFEFEGGRAHTHVSVAAIVDARGEFILDHHLIQQWKPDDEQRLGALLEKAVEGYLDTHLPQWNENEGSEGQMSVSLQIAEDGSLDLVVRGHAIMRTMIERTVIFPKRP